MRYMARGRIRPRGEMNKTEEAYAALLAGRLHADLIKWYAYEPIKLRLANNTFYTPDFMVLDPNGILECHEVKGHWEDDARVKIKVAAATFPFRFIAARPLKRGGGWEIEEF